MNIINSVLFICYLAILIPTTILSTIVFCFWTVYILYMINWKWRSHNYALKHVQQEECNWISIAYNSKTELVKFVFLFLMNILEWFGFLAAFVSNLVTYYVAQNQEEIHKNVSNNFLFEHLHYISFSINLNNSNTVMYPIPIFPKIPNIFFSVVILLFASLCMYLSSRYARKRWIQANKIPLLICLFLQYEIIVQVLASFCSTYIIASWCDQFLLIASLVIASQQYKRLKMVINWSIFDLRNERSYSLKSEVQKEQMFSRMSQFLRIGVILLITAEVIFTISHTLALISQSDTNSVFRSLSLCEKSYFLIPQFHLIFQIFHWTTFFIASIGSYFIIIPYTLHGLVVMNRILWRLIRGKTGYKTHFPGTSALNESYIPNHT